VLHLLAARELVASGRGRHRRSDALLAAEGGERRAGELDAAANEFLMHPAEVSSFGTKEPGFFGVMEPLRTTTGSIPTKPFA
jgi:hypothetical protein